MIAATRPWSGPPVTVTGREPEPDWHHHAACLGMDTDLFYPAKTSGNPREERIATAKAICQICPVAAECLQDALIIGDTWAIRGGLDPDERKRQFGQVCAECGRSFRRPVGSRRVTCSDQCAKDRGARRQREHRQRAGTAR